MNIMCLFYFVSIIEIVYKKNYVYLLSSSLKYLIMIGQSLHSVDRYFCIIMLNCIFHCCPWQLISYISVLVSCLSYQSTASFFPYNTIIWSQINISCPFNLFGNNKENVLSNSHYPKINPFRVIQDAFRPSPGLFWNMTSWVYFYSLYVVFTNQLILYNAIILHQNQSKLSEFPQCFLTFFHIFPFHWWISTYLYINAAILLCSFEPDKLLMLISKDFSMGWSIGWPSPIKSFPLFIHPFQSCAFSHDPLCSQSLLTADSRTSRHVPCVPVHP